jgi:transposase InsO family protein
MPFVAITRSMLSRFQRSLAELRIRHIRTQIDTPWTYGKIEAFWAPSRQRSSIGGSSRIWRRPKPRSRLRGLLQLPPAHGNSIGRPQPNASTERPLWAARLGRTPGRLWITPLRNRIVGCSTR